MKKVIVVSLLFASVGVAAEEAYQLSANVAATSNYIFRGVSFSNDEAAIQGGFDVNHKSGVYAGIWGSSDTGNGEFDFYTGYNFALNNHVSVDIGVVRYTYNGSGGNTTEYHVGASFDIYSVTYHYDETLETHYIEGNVSYEINDKLTADFHLGSADSDSTSSEYDYSATLTYQLTDQFATYVAYSDHEANTKYADSVLYVGLSAEF